MFRSGKRNAVSIKERRSVDKLNTIYKLLKPFPTCWGGQPSA